MPEQLQLQLRQQFRKLLSQLIPCLPPRRSRNYHQMEGRGRRGLKPENGETPSPSTSLTTWSSPPAYSEAIWIPLQQQQ